MTTSSSTSLSRPQLLVANSLCFVSCKAIKTYIVRKPGNEAKMQSICDFQYRKGSVTLQIFLCGHEYSNTKCNDPDLACADYLPKTVWPAKLHLASQIYSVLQH